MRRRRRTSDGRSCGQKIQHRTWDQADVHRWRLIRAGAQAHRITIYQCKRCRNYHVGHTKRGKR